MQAHDIHTLKNYLSSSNDIGKDNLCICSAYSPHKKWQDLHK